MNQLASQIEPWIDMKLNGAFGEEATTNFESNVGCGEMRFRSGNTLNKMIENVDARIVVKQSNKIEPTVQFREKYSLSIQAIP